MRQFDVARNPGARSADRVPFLLVLPNDFLAGLSVTVVAPLVRAKEIPQYPQLHPRFHVGGLDVVLSPLELANIATRELKVVVANLSEERDRIIRALDFLFTGF